MPYYYALSIGKSKFHVAGEGDPTIALYLGSLWLRTESVITSEAK